MDVLVQPYELGGNYHGQFNSTPESTHEVEINKSQALVAKYTQVIRGRKPTISEGLLQQATASKKETSEAEGDEKEDART